MEFKREVETFIFKRSHYSLDLIFQKIFNNLLFRSSRTNNLLTNTLFIKAICQTFLDSE